MKIGLLFLVILGLKSVDSKADKVVLEIDEESERYFKIKTTQLDNVLYKHIIPRAGCFLNGIVQDSTKIWESSDNYECVYALFAYQENEVALIFLKVRHPIYPVNLYFKRVDDSWMAIDIYEYCDEIEQLRKSVMTFCKYELNIMDSSNSRVCSKVHNFGERPYTQFSSNIGYVATAVRCDDQYLWQPEKYGDRCVAAWAYTTPSYYYMIRLVITKYNGDSEIQTFFLVDKKWRLVNTCYESQEDDIYFELPEDFVYPHYFFNLSPICPSKYWEKEWEDQKTISQGYEDLDYNSDIVESGSILNLSDLTANVVGMSKAAIDNVEYKVFGGGNVSYKKVVDYSGVLWSARSDSERCVFAMAPQKNDTTIGLYMVINDCGKFKRLFFDKELSFWFDSDLEKYKSKVESIRSLVADYDVVLDLAKKEESEEAYVENENKMFNYYRFVPKTGFGCREVKNNQRTIWKASNPFDRCVAAWTYETLGDLYYVKLLLTLGRGVSEVVTYLNVRKDWERVSSYFSPIFGRPIEEFELPNPEYPFNHLEDYSLEEREEPSEENRFCDPYEDAKKYEYDPVMPRVSPEDCVELDVADRVKNWEYVTEAVFERTLKLVSYYPPPGKYFNLVKDGSSLMFVGLTQEHVCQGVNFYVKNGKFYLADALVRVNYHHMTIHFKRRANRWDLVEQSYFEVLLNELKKSTQKRKN